MPNWRKVIVSDSDASLNSLYVLTSVTASVFSGSHTGSLFGTASVAISASWAPGGAAFPYSGSAQITGSLGVTGSVNVTGTLTAQTLVVQTVTSSVVYSSGSNIFGNQLTNTQQFTGSVTITGSLNVTGQTTATGFTGSLFGTASYWSGSTAYASTASVAISSSYALSSSFALTASYLPPTAQVIAVSGTTLYSTTPAAGPVATTTTYSIFLGSQAGNYAPSASYSTFLGFQAGAEATSASYSTFIGSGAGSFQVTGSFSTFIGVNAGGNQSGNPALNLGSNNIIIGNGISLPAGTANAINLGGILFASGARSAYGVISSGSAFGAVGINVVTPTSNLQVSGTANVVNFRGSGSVATSSIFTVDGAAGRLFTVNDSLSGSLFSVNTISGLPIIEAFSNNTVSIGQFGKQVFYVSQSAVGLGKQNSLNGILDVSGSAYVSGTLFVTASFSNYAANIAGNTTLTGSLNISGSQIITNGVLLLSSASGFPALTASEALSAGNLINIATGGVRKADSGSSAKQAHGFVLASYATSAPVNVYYAGINYLTSSLVIGSRYFLGAAGTLTTTPPTIIGQLSQEVGVAITPTGLFFQPGPAIVT